MNSKSAIQRIKAVLGLQPQKFYDGKTEQGLAIKMEGEMELGQMVYVATEEGLIPAPPGKHKLEDGTILEVNEEGKLEKIEVGEKETPEMEDDEEMKKQKEMMTRMFADVSLKDGTLIRMEADEPMTGARVLKVGYDDTLSALADGLYETSNGLVLSIIGGAIHGVQTAAENTQRGTGTPEENTIAVENIKEASALVFTEAKDKQGQILESPTFDVGEEVMVVKDGEKTPAPDGEHEVVLKDESGNENKIRIQTKGGKITQRENVEEMENTMMEIAELFKAALTNFEKKLDTISQKQNELETKVSKFAKEPAGSRVLTQKTINETEKFATSKYDGFKRLREELQQKLK